MTVADTQSTLDEYLDALLNGGDFAAKFSDQVSWTTMETGEVIHGREAVRDFIVALHSQLFDATPELGKVYVGDGSAALEALFVGKHTAEFAGIPATGEEVRLPYAVCYDVSNGKIDALRGYFPIHALVQQLTKAAER
jgi:predicted ester cyclase